MAKSATPKPIKTAAQIREERLKAALKANMGRRKAQTRARAAQTTDNGDTDTPRTDTTRQGE